MDVIALEAQERMKKTLESLHSTFNTIRTGRASTALLDRVMVDYYGEKTPVGQIASVSIPEPRQLLIKPYDRDDVKSIIAALAASELGINPINDGTSIRLIIPALNEERRKELTKLAKKHTEDAKVALRNIRRDYIELVKDDEEYSDDLKKRIEADIQKVTDDMVKKLEEAYTEKEKEIMTV